MKASFGPPVCPVCKQYVYFAEELRSMGKSFHRACFKCYCCRKTLDSFSANDHNGELFCRACYAKNFGPQGYRFTPYSSIQLGSAERRSQSQPRLQDCFAQTTQTYQSPYPENGYYHAPPSPPSREQTTSYEDALNHGIRQPRQRWINPNLGAVRCANCPDVVFANERVDACGKAFHRLCFKCTSCRRLLDRGTACDHKKEIFCQNCYTKHFGSTGLKAGTHLRCK
ncbi:Cysteine-rich protein 2-binding protein [Clonorchis sinensis]|uniref:Cysteine-rich protein 2-binding protein n=1 Tax=Clonorchis sinensis TaxID=79923 RepID=A0A8T1MPT1_CLOSI|nr:Cysteine-rich protein 2-binding protein [Clonorchis sinensis]